MLDNNFVDCELIGKIKLGDDLSLEILLKKYKNLVMKYARAYFLADGDFDDLMQEGNIGLYKAIYSYQLSDTTSFFTYATICIKNNILDAISKSKSNKNAILSNSFSLDILASTADSDLSPEQLLFNHDFVDTIDTFAKQSFTEEEYLIFKSYLDGTSYDNIAYSINKDKKYVDNKLQKIKKLLQPIIINYYNY